MNSHGDRLRAFTILGLACLLFLVWFGGYLSFSSVVSVDLPGHVAIIKRLARQVLYGRIFFYDHWWFSGWPAYQFYGFAGHLLTTALLPLTSALSRDPAGLAVNMVLLIGVTTLPVSLSLASHALAFSTVRTGWSPPFGRSIVSLAAVVFGFWYLNLPLDFLGVGASSLWHGGLYLQVFAWHLSLLLWASVFRMVNSDERSLPLVATLLLTLLILTHVFAAVFSLMLIGLTFLRFEQVRGRLVLTLLLALGASAFWWLPMVATAGSFTIPHSEPPQGDIFEMIVHQPFDTFAVALSRLAQLRFAPVEIAPVLLFAALLAAFSSRHFWNAPALVAFSLFGLVLMLVLSSSYVAASFPLGLHYYRFSSLMLLYLVVLAAACTPHLLRLPESLQIERLARTTFVVFCILSIAMTAAIGTLRGRAVQKLDERASFKAQHAVLAYLKETAAAGRVGFEYFRDRKIFPFLSPHFMESMVGSIAGRETVNGLFIQSSLSSQFVSSSAKALGIDAYRVPAPWLDSDLPDPQLGLDQLLRAGVGQVVVSSVAARDSLQKLTGLPGKSIPPYYVQPLAPSAPPLIEPIQQKLVTYDDRLGGAPFSLVESLFYLDADLYRRTVLISGDAKELPAGPDILALAHDRGESPGELLFQLPSDSRGAVERVLGRNFAEKAREIGTVFRERLLPQIRERISGGDVVPAVLTPELSFRAFSQQLVLTNLEPGRFYRVAYSYSPYFRAVGGRVFRAVGEQMVIQPEANTMVLRYSRLADPLVLCATLASIASVLAMSILALWVRLKSLRAGENGAPVAQPEVPHD